MSSQVIVFAFATICDAVLIFLAGFFSVMFSDLECDYINPIDLCSKLNKFIMPEMIGHAFLFCLFLVNGNWLSMLINLPLVAYHAMQVRQSKHQLDPTEIFRTLSVHKKEAFVKIGFYCTCFFFYLYCMIVALIAMD